MSKKEQQRIEKAFSWVQRKLNTKFDLTFESFNPLTEKAHGGPTGRLAIARTARGSQDPNSFIVYYYVNNTKKKSFNILKQDAMHELIHALNAAKSDVFEDLLEHVKGAVLKRNFEKRWMDVEESTTYALERSFGPFVIVRYTNQD